MAYIYHIEGKNSIYIGQAKEDIPYINIETPWSTAIDSRLWKHFANLITGSEKGDGARQVFKNTPWDGITITIFPATSNYYGLGKDAFQGFLDMFVPSQLAINNYAKNIVNTVSDAKNIREKIYKAIEHNNPIDSLVKEHDSKEQELINNFKKQVVANASSPEAMDIAEILHILYYARSGKKKLTNRSIGGQSVLEWKVVGEYSATRALTRFRTSPHEALQIISTLERPQGRNLIELNKVAREIFKNVVQDPDLISDLFKLDRLTVKGNAIHLGLSKEEKLMIAQKMKDSFKKIIDSQYKNKGYGAIFDTHSLPQINDVLFTKNMLEQMLTKARSGVKRNNKTIELNGVTVTEWTSLALKDLQDELIKQWKKENFLHWNFSNFLKVIPKTNVKSDAGKGFLKKPGGGMDFTPYIKIFAIIVFAYLYKTLERGRLVYYSDSLILESKLIKGGSPDVGYVKLNFQKTLQQQMRDKYRHTEMNQNSKFLNSGWNLFYHNMLRLMPDSAWPRKTPTILDDKYSNQLQAQKAKPNSTYVIQNYTIDATPNRPLKKDKPNKIYPYYRIPTDIWSTYNWSVDLSQLKHY